jgi:AraC-like DNA-binding protein
MVQASEHIQYRKFLQRETATIHAPYLPEMDFYAAIRAGDVKRVRKLCSEEFHKKPGFGKLSKDKLRNMKYHFVITTAMVARSCITGGMPMSESYGMSDYYIELCDRADSIEKISSLHDEMCIAYAKAMKDKDKEHIYSKQVTKCIDYILEHLDTRIKIEDLSEVTGLSNSYLSRLFKKETGMAVSRYILVKKIETACNMLSFSDYPIMWISNALAFPSQSYFTKVFTSECGMTPKRYRENSYFISIDMDIPST